MRGHPNRASRAARAVCEVLESRRLLSTIVWLNRGDAGNDTDLFNSCFGSRAALARSVVDASIQSWENVIASFNYPAGTTQYSLSISMATGGTSFGGNTQLPL